MAERGLVIQPPFLLGKIMTAKTTNRADKGKPSAPKAEKAPEHVIFRTAERHTHEFEIMGIRGIRGVNQCVTFIVPADQADRFAQHIHVTSGRVSRVG